jgi:hypothetical protein
MSALCQKRTSALQRTTARMAVDDVTAVIEVLDEP